MHQCNVAHGYDVLFNESVEFSYSSPSNIQLKNLLMDESAVIPKGSHYCKPRTHDGYHIISTWRNRCDVPPVQYYIADFGSSIQYSKGSGNAIAVGCQGGLKIVPEASDTIPYDPFKADVYQLGHVLLEVIQVSALSSRSLLTLSRFE
jgi:hypothetical protein